MYSHSDIQLSFGFGYGSALLVRIVVEKMSIFQHNRIDDVLITVLTGS